MAAITTYTALGNDSTVKQVAGGVPTVIPNSVVGRATYSMTATAADTFTPGTTPAPPVSDAWFVTTATGVKTQVTESAGVFTIGTGPSAAAGYLVIEYARF